MRVGFVIIVVYYTFVPLYNVTAQVNDSLLDRVNAFIEPNLSDTSTLDITNGWFNNNNNQDVLIDSLPIRSNQKTWSKQLQSLLVTESREKADPTKESGYDPSTYFANHADKTIRNIKFKQLDVFGPSVQDTFRYASNWLEHLGNTMHISTWKSTLRNYLFFEEGESVDPYLLADNERIFRTIPNIQDARIYVLQIEENPELVDILIVTKDVWPIGVTAEVFDVLYGKAGIWSNNMFGLGHQLSYTGFFNSERDPRFGYELKYRTPNIGNTLTSFEIFHNDTWNLLISRAILSRNFISPSIRFGGELSYEKFYQISNLITRDTIYEKVESDVEKYDLWLGYSVPITLLGNRKFRESFFLTGRGIKTSNPIRPASGPNNNYRFHNRNMYLVSTGLAWQGYFNTILVYGFGDTEDLPFGALLKLTSGLEKGEFQDRYYVGATASWANNIQGVGFLSTSVNFGGYLNKGIEQGLLNINAMHISNLFGNVRHSFRNFTEVKYYQGINRFDDEFVSIFGAQGIRGLNYLALRGNKKVTLNTELVYFSPQYIWGFRFVYYAFIDGGLIDFNNKRLLTNRAFTSIGAGVRIKNERLVFNTLQISFRLFPWGGFLPDETKTYVELKGRPDRSINDYSNKRPEILEFR